MHGNLFFLKMSIGRGKIAIGSGWIPMLMDLSMVKVGGKEGSRALQAAQNYLFSMTPSIRRRAV
jgi:hypothetical protein